MITHKYFFININSLSFFIDKISYFLIFVLKIILHITFFFKSDQLIISY